MTQAKAAKFAGTSPQIVTAWMQDRVFHARLEGEIYSRSLDDAAFHKHLRRKALRVFTVEHSMAFSGFRWPIEKFDGQSEGVSRPFEQRGNVFL